MKLLITFKQYVKHKSKLGFFIWSQFRTLYNKLFNSKVGAQKLTLKNDSLCIEGYPRSGNSFLFHIFNTYWPSTKIGHHLHAAQHVLLSLKLKIPVILVLRNPKDAILSYYLYNKKQIHPKHLVEEYILFHETILPFSEQILIINFENLTKRTVEVMNQISKKLKFIHNYESSNNINSEEVFKKIENEMKKLNINMVSSSPSKNKIREKLKSDNRNFVNNIIPNDTWKKAEIIYENLARLSQTIKT